MIRIALICTLPFLASCTHVRDAGDNLARTGARAAVDEVIVTRFPNVDGGKVTPFTDCVIDAASGREIGSLASAALTGVDENTVSLVLDIAQRPEAAKCLTSAALKSGLAG